MPATGPVSAGGDDGRDAESYWSTLADELPNTSLFTSLSTSDSLVMAATIQKTGVPAKIRSDLAEICGGPPVDRVIFFTVEPVAVAKRHELQSFARETYAVELEILDAQAIAEELASHDLFFLAVEYLHLPSELAPETPADEPDLPGWYIDDRQKWRGEDPLAGSMGELVDLRDGLRHAMFNDSARADLPDWLAYAQNLRSAAMHDDVLSRVEYEMILAAGLGIGSLRTADHVLRSYFQRLEDSQPDTGTLMDAVTLLRLTEAMQPRGATTVTISESARWHDRIESAADSMFASADGPNERAYLLTIIAILAHGPIPLTQEQIDAVVVDDLQPMPELYREMNEARHSGHTPMGAPSDGVVRDLEKGMAALVTLIDLLPNAPLVPLDQLTQLFDIAAPVLIDHPDYARVREALDAKTAERSGRSAAGYRAQARALALLGSGRPIPALREIHAAKMYWLHGDAAEGAALMMLLASKVYENLRLPLAAKQYAMSAASIARESGDPELAVLIARGFILAATYEHLAGQWLTATDTFRVGILAQAQYAADPWNLERYTYFSDMLVDQSLILRSAQSLRPQLMPMLQEAVASTKLDTLMEPMLATAAQLPAMSEEETSASAARSGMGRPFADAGEVREFRWAATDNTWSVTTQNDRLHVLAAERFTAAAQIALAELADEDVLLLPGPIDIEILLTTDESAVPGRTFVPADELGQKRHRVYLTATRGLNVAEQQLEVASAVLQVIATQSLLSREDFEQILGRTFDHGLPHMMTCVQAYDDLVDIHRDEFYAQLANASGGPIRSDPDPELVPGKGLRHLPSELHHSYDAQESQADIRARYTNLLIPVRYTVERLRDDAGFQEIIAELRSEGWKDWHLLTAIANIVVNRRAADIGLDLTTSISDSELEQFQQIKETPESSSGIEVPVDSFTPEAMRLHLSTAACVTAHNWGLEIRRNVDAASFLDMLGARFNYWADDVDHPPIFDR